MTDNLVRAPFRLAIRAEGEWVNAYLAERNTMEGATLIASMLRAPFEKHPELFERWRDLLADAVKYATEEVMGQTPQMLLEPAPEHEKAGRA